MLVELGPVAAADVLSWARLARRLVVEFRVDPGDLVGVVNDDLLAQWSALIEEWANEAARSDTFRWSRQLDSEVGEFLLHGLNRFVRLDRSGGRMTDDEVDAHRPFTLHVMRAFVDALATEGLGHLEFAEQLEASLED